MKVPFKMPEIFPHTLGSGLEIWASILCDFFVIENNDNKQKMRMLHDIDARSFLSIIGHVCHVQKINRIFLITGHS